MPDNIMEKTGKNNKVFTTYTDTFLNSQCLFIEYHDIIQSPWYVFLISAKDSELFKSLFDTFDIDNLSYDGIYEWYIHRRHINPLFDIPLNQGVFETYFNSSYDVYKDSLNKLVNEEMKNKDIVEVLGSLSFIAVLNNLLAMNVVRDIVIYTKENSDAIKDDINSLFNGKVKYVSGEFIEVLKDIPRDSTYVFSDITKIKDLEEANKLDYSSILIPVEYGYNYDDNKEFIIDLVDIAKNHIFKLNFFNIQKMKG
jgi:hypothetical protein